MRQRTNSSAWLGALSNSYLPPRREPHYIIAALLGALPCPRFIQHTLHLALVFLGTKRGEGKK